VWLRFPTAQWAGVTVLWLRCCSLVLVELRSCVECASCWRSAVPPSADDSSQHLRPLLERGTRTVDHLRSLGVASICLAGMGAESPRDRSDESDYSARSSHAVESRPQGRPDAILDVTGPDGAKVRLSVEAKMGLVPRAVADLKTRLDGYSSDLGLVISPFLTRSTRERLRAENLNFLDLTGNVRLVLARPGLYVETQGADQDPSPKRQPGRSLRGAKAARIVRALCDVPPPLPISELAAQGQGRHQLCVTARGVAFARSPDRAPNS
jgi:hypothetical protein